MEKNQRNDSVGDVKAPSLKPAEDALRIGSDQAESLYADKSPIALKPSVVNGFAVVRRQTKSQPVPVTTCKQLLWFSFFFDGTGNNRYADEGMRKHSNVAKLFSVHQPIDQINGVYSFYLQGVGTYFPEIGDDGGDLSGLSFGRKGTDRLQYALKKFDESIKRHLALANSPANAISEINMSVFGFSRGAALARAFVNLLLKERCAKVGDKWVFKNGSWPFRVRFMGLFDTVASVGLPMSNNTTSKVGTALSSIRYIVNDRLVSYMETRPEQLAFMPEGRAGADPAPGIYDGHSDWGNKLNIDPMVEEVRHFVAAHEIRNSFPVDSISSLREGRISTPAQFFEAVYPGVHSDVGGSYAPGEGGRAPLPSQNLGVIPLLHMYNYALGKGVPLLQVSRWSEKNHADFAVHPDLVASYNHYISIIGSSARLGELVNRNMGLYYAWRFRAIRIKLQGNRNDLDKISKWNAKFKKDEEGLNKEIDMLSQKKDAATRELDILLQRRVAGSTDIFAVANFQLARLPSEKDIDMARKNLKDARDELLSVKARLDALPKMEKLQLMLEFYDEQLLNDVKAIRGPLCEKYPGFPPPDVLRRNLRPHYKILVKAYEDEFVYNNGLTDEKIIRFFDTYIHDSLAGFAKDATLPSDPRVVYLGGDEKYKYASISNHVGDGDRRTEAA